MQSSLMGWKSHSDSSLDGSCVGSVDSHAEVSSYQSSLGPLSAGTNGHSPRWLPARNCTYFARAADIDKDNFESP